MTGVFPRYCDPWGRLKPSPADLPVLIHPHLTYRRPCRRSGWLGRLQRRKIIHKKEAWTHVSSHPLERQVSTVQILWRVNPLLRGDSVNNIRCYGAPAVYACAVTSHSNRKSDAGGVFCRSAPRLYDSTDLVLLSEYSWGFTCGVLTSGQRKRNNLHW
jgi:hypothetical protein